MTNTKQYFDSPAFQERYHCEADLGAFRSRSETVFRLWAPTAQAVTLRLYTAGTGGAPMAELPLARGERGLWEARLGRDLDGVYYDYAVTVDGVSRVSADPYARAAGLNGARSMVIDLRRTDPPGWESDRPPELKPETVIYEIHVKDFSWDASSGVPEAYRGKFKALCRADTSLDGAGQFPTCLAYLRRLGVTHVQLMPVADYGSVDEGGAADQFNWGYDPVNYNVPEGSYSTDPARGEVRIRELKEAVQSLHRNGFRVILDVVYNHTYFLDSWLWRTAPWYYSRQREDGSPSNGSGCGNDAATERSMCAKYILDSVLYWAEEYHVDGFRFDLMGLMDVELMERIRRALDGRWGAGEKLLFGEPWSASRTAARPGSVLADKAGLAALDEQTGAFCDATRDAVKGSISQADAPGFVNGGALDAGVLAHCVRGWTGSGGRFSAKAPSQTVTYLSSHDDWTLWDKLVLTMDPARDFEGRSPELLRANRLAAAICFACQGRLFLLGGEEFARTKRGVRDSVRAPLSINRMDWRRAWENRDLVDYYRGLIALRMRLTGLQDKSPRAGERVFAVRQLTPGCAALRVDNTGAGSPWRQLLLVFNTGAEPVGIKLPPGGWELLADGDSSFLWQDPEQVWGECGVPPVSAAIFGQR